MDYYKCYSQVQVPIAKINNVKAHWIVSKNVNIKQILNEFKQIKKGEETQSVTSEIPATASSGWTVTKSGNILVLRANGINCPYVYTIFPIGPIVKKVNGHFVNACGIKTIPDLNKALQTFVKICQLQRQDISPCIVDNITANYDTGKKIDLSRIECKQVHFSVKLCLETEKFACLYIKFLPADGCVGVFASGKLSIVGVKGQEEANIVLRRALHVLQTSNGGFVG